jgi:FdhD protein
MRKNAAEHSAHDLSLIVPDEVPIAFVYNGSTHAVLLATPTDLTDFATGFSLTEGIAGALSDIAGIEVVPTPFGIELRIWLNAKSCAKLHRRRRAMAGPSGCGLCGIESLAEAVRPVRMVDTRSSIEPDRVGDALQALADKQVLRKLTTGVHAAALFAPTGGIACVREDVGRHNAVDKLAGAIAASAIDVNGAAIVVTSRVSVEIVQKVGMIGAPLLLSMSVPTSLAIRTAKKAGISLMSVSRNGHPLVYA